MKEDDDLSSGGNIIRLLVLHLLLLLKTCLDLLTEGTKQQDDFLIHK